MTFYVPKKLRPWAIIHTLIRTLIYLLKHWPLIVLLTAYLSPTAPHVMISYDLDGTSLRQHRGDCQYLGLRGIVRKFDSDCPFILLIRYPNKPF